MQIHHVYKVNIHVSNAYSVRSPSRKVLSILNSKRLHAICLCLVFFFVSCERQWKLNTNKIAEIKVWRLSNTRNQQRATDMYGRRTCIGRWKYDFRICCIDCTTYSGKAMVVAATTEIRKCKSIIAIKIFFTSSSVFLSFFCSLAILKWKCNFGASRCNWTSPAVKKKK